MTTTGGKRKGPGKTARMADINVTPMVDVTLVLLVIFMVTAPMMTTGIPLDLPQGGKEVLAGADKALRISVSEDGTVYVGTEPTDVPSLVGRVVEMRRNDPELGIVISGDRIASYGAVMGVMGALKDVGVEKVGLETGSGDALQRLNQKPKPRL